MFVFKQKTAYEMRISDWSSDVCSSDLIAALAPQQFVQQLLDVSHACHCTPPSPDRIRPHVSTPCQARQPQPGRKPPPARPAPHPFCTPCPRLSPRRRLTNVRRTARQKAKHSEPTGPEQGTTPLTRTATSDTRTT